MSEVKGVPIRLMKSVQNYSPLVHSTLRLFNAVPVKNQSKKNPSKEITKITVNNGFVLSPVIISNYTKNEVNTIIEWAIDELGLSPRQMNATFNKSWKKVRDAPMEQLVFEQITHYMTTYGYKELGVYNEDTVFIPAEKLELPLMGDGVKLKIIKGYTKKQLKDKLLKLLNSGIALDNIDDIVEVAKFVGFTDKEVLKLNNKEVRVRLYNELDLLPENPIEFLRLALYNTTESTLLITNRKTVQAIKESNKSIHDLFEEYDEYAGYTRLAEIFNRFKRLFLAFKSEEEMIPVINRISTLAKKYHKPIKQSFLNNITGMLNRNEKISIKKLNDELDNVNIFRKIRLAQSLSYRASGANEMLYRVRNGKSYAAKIDFDNIEGAKKIYDIIIKSIAKDLKHLKGKEIYIPENIVYSLPSSVKQFSGNIPTGSYVSVGKDMIFGVYWENVRGQTDLDLHGMSQNCGHIGWNTTQRSGNTALLRTGDITDAPNGATELFYINKDYEDIVLFNLNYYNYREGTPVPYKLMVADEHPNSFGTNYTIDPNNMKCVINSVIDKPQITLGLGLVKDGECRFYFNETGLGNTNVVKGYQYIEIARSYLAKFGTTQVTLNEVLDKVGAKIVTKQTKKSIDLSPENLEKDTFINLLVK